MQKTQVHEKYTNIPLVVVSVLIGLLICEFVYRGVLAWHEDK
jgi:hypothetical protein